MPLYPKVFVILKDCTPNAIVIPEQTAPVYSQASVIPKQTLPVHHKDIVIPKQTVSVYKQASHYPKTIFGCIPKSNR